MRLHRKQVQSAATEGHTPSAVRSVRGSMREILARDRFWLLCVILVAMLVRVVYVLQLRASPWFDDPAVDQGFHHAWAQAIAKGDTFLDGPYYRAPLYTWFLGGIYRVFGPFTLPARMLQAGLGALSCGLLFLIGRLVFDRTVGLLASFCAALAWVIVYFDAELLSPVVIVFLNLLLLLGLFLVRENQRSALWMLNGVLLGLSAVTRPDILLYTPVIAGWIAWLNWRSWRRISVYALAFATGCLLPILPVTVRNYIAGDEFVLIAANGGVNLFIGNNARADGFTASVPGVDPNTTLAWYYDQRERAERAEGRSLKDSEVSRYYLREAWRFMTGEPARAVKLLVKKARYFWSRWEIANNQDIYFVTDTYTPISRWLPLGFWLIGPLGLLGMLLAMHRGRDLFPLWGMVLTYYLLGIVFFVNARYRLPAVIVLILLGSYALQWLHAAVQRRRWRSLIVAGLVLCGAGLVVAQVPPGTDRHQIQGHRHAGYTLARQGRHAEAEAMMLEALAREEQYGWPARAGAWYTLGFAQLQQGKLVAAEASFRRTLQLDPAYPDARASLAEALLKGGQYRQAQQEYTQLLSEQPADARLQALVGAALLLSGAEEEGRQRLLAAAGTDSAQTAVVAWVAETLTANGRETAAYQLLLAAHEHLPREVPLILALVRLLVRSPTLAEQGSNGAIDLAREAVRLTGEREPLAWHGLTLAYGAAGRLAEARQAAQRTVALVRSSSDTELQQWLQSELQPYLVGASR